MKKILLLLCAAALIFAACKNKKEQNEPMAQQVELLNPADFETTIDSLPVALYTIKNANGMVAQITNFGARVVALWAPDKDGGFQDVVWGFPTIADYIKTNDHFCGPIVGRVGNRIRNGQFTLNGKEYQLELTAPGYTLHGGPHGFYTKVWTAEQKDSNSVTMTLLSPDGDGGYPGNFTLAVTYSLTDDNEFKIEYSGTTDAPTIVNPTSHCYFNLHGTSARSTNTHIMTIYADSVTQVDTLITPTGELMAVEGTPLDFRTPTAIGDRIEADFESMKMAGGYDHNWVLKPNAEGISATVYEPTTGIVMHIITDQPGLQFYSGNFFKGDETGKRGDVNNYRCGGIALEAQNFPDAINHPNFPSPILNPGETYTQTTIYKFEVKK